MSYPMPCSTNKTCPQGSRCVNGQCVSDCRLPGSVCMLGGVCDQTTGKCVNGGGVPDTNFCDSQAGFNQAFYKALRYARKRDNNRLAGPLAVYMIIHMIFLIWGVVLAFKSHPPANRTVHITLAMVFGPAYVLAYYLNAFQ